MKLQKTLKSFSLVLAAGFIFSCSSETNELQTGADSEIGAYARVVESSSDKTTNLLDTGSSVWDAKIEFVDAEGGSLIDSYSLYATFRDNTILSDTDPDYSISEKVLIDTWEKSEFSTGSTYPTLDITVSAADVISKLGLDLANTEGGDAIIYSGQITLSDGRVFSEDNSGKSITSELFYNDAFGFNSTFVCVPPSPITGDWKIDMWDSYGDGWNGGYISVIIDGVENNFSALESNGTNITSVIINVPPGTTSLDWKYNAGSYEEENTFKIYAPSGNLVLADGPTPSTGKMALNLCSE